MGKNKIKYSLLCSVLLSLCTVKAQNVQIGCGTAVNNTFFHKGTSVYSDDNVSGAIAPGLGLFVPVNIRFTPSWHLKTGLGFHSRKYSMRIYDFDTSDIPGKFIFDCRFTSWELPLLISFKTASEKKYKFEYNLGLVSTYYLPAQVGASYSDGDKSHEGIIVLLPSKREQIFSPEIYAGVTLVKMVEGSRRQEFTLSYQYGFTPTTQYNIYALVTAPGEYKEFNFTMRPTLSAFKLSYAFYPKWLNFGGINEE